MSKKSDASQMPSSTDSQPDGVNDVEKENATEAELQDSLSKPHVEGVPQDWEDQLVAAKEAAEKNYNDYLRSRAELDNHRKRAERDLANAHKYALDKIAADILSIRDSMELGLQAENATAESLREGTELTLKMLVQVMERYGIKEINPEGEKFNPDLHQAMSMQESHEIEPNHVMLVMQKGYLLNDRLIRPALVTVSKAPAASE